jgi:hypothetical protein
MVLNVFKKFNHGQSVVTIRTWFVLWVGYTKLCFMAMGTGMEVA